MNVAKTYLLQFQAKSMVLESLCPMSSLAVKLIWKDSG